MGNLVRDPELRVTPSGLSICRCTLACSRNIKAESGMREEVTFVDVESFGKQAEVVAKHFVKGKPIFIEGRLRLNEWQNASGEKRSKLMVVMENFVFVGNNPAAGAIKSDSEEAKANFSYEHVNNKPDNVPPTENYNTSVDEDIPF